MKKYKLTNQDLRTHNGFQWEVGKTVKTDGKENQLCNSSWLHYYDHPVLAVLMNPIHAEIENPKMFEVSATGKHLNDNGLKGGCTRMKLVKEIEVPEVTITQKVAFAILCSLEVYKEKGYILWAENWLKGERDAAAVRAAAWAAGAAARAAGAAVRAVRAARAAEAAGAAARAAGAARAAEAAGAAAWAAAEAAEAAGDVIDLIKIAEEAMKY